MSTLFATIVANAKPAEKDYKLSDGAGLYLLVRPNGSKLWRLNYRYLEKYRTLAFGAWPEVTLADARGKRDEARKLLAAGLDPSHERKVAMAKARVEENDTFRTVAKEWIAKNERENMAAITLSKIRWLLDIAYPKIGNRPIAKITAQEVLIVLRSVEATGRYESARRMRSVLGRVFAAIGSVSLIAVTWMALKPRLFHRTEAKEELSQPDSRATSDTLNGVPSTYGDVPRLGPPLPGDLGKPILEHQQSMVAAISPADQQLQQAEAAERERQLAELKAARQSGVLVQGRQANSEAEVGATPAASPASTAPDAPKLALDPDRDPNAQGRKAEFVGTLDPRGDVNPHALAELASPYTLAAGSVISASLITGLRSDLPGLVTAQVTENTYDSATGRILLIPQGARLIGSYDSVVAFGQKRALVVWQRIIMPDGSSLRIDNVPATDPSGFAGLEDKVDFHTWQLLKGVALSTLLGVSSNLALSGQGDLVQAIRMSTQDNVSRAGDQITQRNLGIQPTITIRPGAPVRLVVHKDLVLAPWNSGDH